jgi:hypothetical protein
MVSLSFAGEKVSPLNLLNFTYGTETDLKNGSVDDALSYQGFKPCVQEQSLVRPIICADFFLKDFSLRIFWQGFKKLYGLGRFV